MTLTHSTEPNGFLNLNKPYGLTAHDCISRLRKLLHMKRIGHSGTLDPAATGVLPIAVGKVTRLLRFLPSGKGYNATIRFGVVTATDDLEGEVITTQPCPELTLPDIEPILALFQGKIQQRPPAFSAIQVQGVRLYELARAGKPVEVPIRTVEVKDIQIIAWRGGSFPELDVAITCGTGTYIRAIARDLGEKLGCGGTLAGLERTHSNGFDLVNSLTLDAVTADSPLIAPAIALSHLDAIILDSFAAKRWTQGQVVDCDDGAIGDRENYSRVHNEEMTFLGIGQRQNQGLIPIVVTV